MPISEPILNLEKLPASPDIHVWSDYIELLCLANRDGLLSKADIIDRLEEGVDDLAVAEHEALKSENLYDKRTNKIELKASDWFRHLEYRTGVFGQIGFYPFEVFGDSLRLKERFDLSHRLYLILLLASNLRYVPKKVQNVLTKDFETISEVALTKCLPSQAEVYIFGSGGSPQSKRFSGNLFTKITSLAKSINARLLATEHNFSAHDVGDSGLDIVGWVPMGDTEGGLICVFGQCACTDEWVSKQHSSGPSAWNNKIHFTVPPINAVFIPFCFRNANGNWFNEISVHQTIVFDRVRFAHLLKDSYQLLTKLPALKEVENVISYKESLV